MSKSRNISYDGYDGGLQGRVWLDNASLSTAIPVPDGDVRVSGTSFNGKGHLAGYATRSTGFYEPFFWDRETAKSTVIPLPGNAVAYPSVFLTDSDVLCGACYSPDRSFLGNRVFVATQNHVSIYSDNGLADVFGYSDDGTLYYNVDNGIGATVKIATGVLLGFEEPTPDNPNPAPPTNKVLVESTDQVLFGGLGATSDGKILVFVENLTGPVDRDLRVYVASGEFVSLKQYLPPGMVFADNANFSIIGEGGDILTILQSANDPNNANGVQLVLFTPKQPSA